MSGSSFVFREGTFQLGSTPSGEWLIWIPDVERYGYVKSIRYGDQESLNGTIKVDSSTPQPLRIEMSKQGGSVELTVETQASPALSQEVVLVPEGEHAQNPQRYRERRSTINNQQGQPAFQFLHVAPGEYRAFALSFIDDNLIKDTGLLNALENYSERITVEEGGHVSKQLKPIPLDELLDKF